LAGITETCGKKGEAATSQRDAGTCKPKKVLNVAKRKRPLKKKENIFYPKERGVVGEGRRC